MVSAPTQSRSPGVGRLVSSFRRGTAWAVGLASAAGGPAAQQERPQQACRPTERTRRSTAWPGGRRRCSTARRSCSRGGCRRWRWQRCRLLCSRWGDRPVRRSGSRRRHRGGGRGHHGRLAGHERSREHSHERERHARAQPGGRRGGRPSWTPGGRGECLRQTPASVQVSATSNACHAHPPARQGRRHRPSRRAPCPSAWSPPGRPAAAGTAPSRRAPATDSRGAGARRRTGAVA